MIFELVEVENIIGYSFNDKNLLRQCFTHSSYANEHDCSDNELLEFFGDAIMDFIVTEYLMRKKAGDEGKLTVLRSEIVSKKPLLEYVERVKLNGFMLLGNGIQKNKTFNEKLFSSLFEAIVAGIYIDGGMEKAREFVTKTIIADFERASKRKKPLDAEAKTKLQEYVQQKKIGSISYQTLSQKGPVHLPVFKACVCLNGTRLAEGEGTSKKLAEASAAQKALSKLIKRQKV